MDLAVIPSRVQNVSRSYLLQGVVIARLQRGRLVCGTCERRPRLYHCICIMDAIGKPCCACRASWQLEAPLFLHLATLQAGARDTHHTSIEQNTVPDSSLSAVGLRGASRSSTLFFPFLCNVTFRSHPSPVNKVCIFYFQLPCRWKSIRASWWACQKSICMCMTRSCIPRKREGVYLTLR
jgi:hypothetical protein